MHIFVYFLFEYSIFTTLPVWQLLHSTKMYTWYLDIIMVDKKFASHDTRDRFHV